MRQRRILAATAAAVLGTVALPVLGVPTAQASTSVVVYACGMAGNWQCPVRFWYGSNHGAIGWWKA
jgi:hypothetical protein